MKTLLILLLSVGAVFGQSMLPYVGPAWRTQASGGCGTLSQYNTNRANYGKPASTQIGSYTTNVFIGSAITASNSVTVCKIIASVDAGEAIANNETITAYIYTDGSGEPGTVVATSDSIDIAASGNIELEFTISASLTASTTYWLVYGTSDATLWYHYIRPQYFVSETGSNKPMVSQDGSTWVEHGAASANSELPYVFLTN